MKNQSTLQRHFSAIIKIYIHLSGLYFGDQHTGKIGVLDEKMC